MSTSCSDELKITLLSCFVVYLRRINNHECRKQSSSSKNTVRCMMSLLLGFFSMVFWGSSQRYFCIISLILYCILFYYYNNLINLLLFFFFFFFLSSLSHFSYKRNQLKQVTVTRKPLAVISKWQHNQIDTIAMACAISFLHLQFKISSFYWSLGKQWIRKITIIDVHHCKSSNYHKSL